jgi:hypothetical protein
MEVCLLLLPHKQGSGGFVIFVAGNKFFIAFLGTKVCNLTASCVALYVNHLYFGCK